MAGLIGVFGGTFDPPHLGHLILADCARAELQLEKVLWVLTPVPPHKPDMIITRVSQRLAMLEAAIADNAHFALSRADLDREPPHYSHGTMEVLRDEFPGDHLVYLMGSDSLKHLHEWNQPLRFIQLCDAIGIMQRYGEPFGADDIGTRLPGLQEKLRFFTAPYVGVSGRDIRHRVKSGAPYRYLVTKAVAEIIERSDLYR